ncbi:hypothetical protein M0R45_009139 [Rubus argutus]|uniref:Uncharacterized protein n=1 Tax=Rubus argutus TaxID=59490 RepID=A0AAW1Y3L5_RUBAR
MAVNFAPNRSAAPIVIVVFFKGEGADIEVPVVVPVPDLEVLHQGPVVVFVALRELLEVVGKAVEEYLARERVNKQGPELHDLVVFVLGAQVP